MSPKQQQPRSDSVARARAALAALAGSTDYQATAHEIDLAEALTALITDYEALRSEVEERCAVAFDRGVDAELQAYMSPDHTQGYKFPTNPYRQQA